jgi:uncharacterized protein YjbI with pentapeptide repeats
LTGADLTGADLTGADLRDTDLSGADLSGAKGVVLGPQRSDGYLFWLTGSPAQPIVRAGCRTFTLPEARAHWTETRGETALGDETMAILLYLESQVGRLK